MIKKEFAVQIINGWFFVEDGEVNERPLLAWGEAESDAHLAAAANIIGVGTIRDHRTVPIIVEICEKEPDKNFDSWSHVVDCSIILPSGSVKIGSSNGYSSELIRGLASGIYRVRVYYGDIEREFDYDINPDDHYRIVLWPGEVSDVQVLKQGRFQIEADNEYYDTKTVEQLISELRQGDIGERVHAARSLGKLRPQQAFEPLVAALKDRSVFVRKAAVGAIARFGVGAKTVLTNLQYSDKRLWQRASELKFHL